MDKSIENIISETLSVSDFVCIDNLGTFLVKKESSKIDSKLGLAIPPSRKVVFNADLKSGKNDSLMQTLTKNLFCDNDTANKLLNDFLKKVNEELYKKGSFYFENLGTLILSNNTLRFEQDSNINIDNDSFGLPKVNFSRFVTENQNLKLRPSMPKTESNTTTTVGQKAKPKNKMIWVWVLTPFVLGLASVGYLWENRANQSYASINPFFVPITLKEKEVKTDDSVKFNYDDPMGRNTSADVVEAAEQTNVSQAVDSSSNDVAVVHSGEEAETPVSAVDQEKLAKSTVIMKAGELISGKSNRFYIICASFQTLKKAEEQAVKLEEKGLETVKIIEPHGNVDRYRISLMDFENEAEANKKVKELRKQFGEEIWVNKY